MRWTGAGNVRVEVTGLDPETVHGRDDAGWQTLLPVYAGRADDAPPMAGTYRFDSGVLTFEPAFPPEPGVTYRAVLRSGGTPLTAEYTAPPRPAAAATAVAQVYPTADRLPENLLKFYVHFSGPMRRGRIYEHIRLLDGDGREVELPFLEIDEELWDPAMTRLTLFIDPGRIKRGVAPLEDVGPALVAGRRFKLVIDKGLADAAGNPLTASFEKSFGVGPPDRAPPDPTKWKVTAPPASGRAPVVLAFPEAMEHALALRLIAVNDGAGNAVTGRPALSAGETRWAFTPDAAWRAGSYRVTVKSTVEDLAGNNIGKPFDVDLAEGTKRPETPVVVTIPFEVR
jgi:hypothetical protein